MEGAAAGILQEGHVAWAAAARGRAPHHLPTCPTTCRTPAGDVAPHACSAPVTLTLTHTGKSFPLSVLGGNETGRGDPEKPGVWVPEEQRGRWVGGWPLCPCDRLGTMWDNMMEDLEENQ